MVYTAAVYRFNVFSQNTLVFLPIKGNPYLNGVRFALAQRGLIAHLLFFCLKAAEQSFAGILPGASYTDLYLKAGRTVDTALPVFDSQDTSWQRRQALLY